MKNKPVKIKVELPFNDILKVIEGLTIDQKMKVIKRLEKDTFKERFYSLVNDLKDNDLTMDDITKEVDDVRTAMYEKKKQLQRNH